jgi:hypothetical protein
VILNHKAQEAGAEEKDSLVNFCIISIILYSI